jgi:hypothetical protein
MERKSPSEAGFLWRLPGTDITPHGAHFRMAARNPWAVTQAVADCHWAHLHNVMVVRNIRSVAIMVASVGKTIGRKAQDEKSESVAHRCLLVMGCFKLIPCLLLCK